MLIARILQRKAAEKSEKSTKASKKKDPNAPKRALSAYMFFSQDWRERIKTENPGAGFGMSSLSPSALLFSSCSPRSLRTCADKKLSSSGEVGKLLGAKWKEMDEEEKQVRFTGFVR